jgi:hypothetical protein
MEFEIDGHIYTVGKISTRIQFHIARRMATVLARVASVEMKDASSALPIIASAIGELSDADADFVIFEALKCVSRKQEKGLGWGPVSSGAELMYSDINMVAMLKLVWEALSYNMKDFFSALPQELKDEVQKASAL